MKVAVTSTGQSLDSSVDPRFGRCQYFVMVDTDTMAAVAVPNAGSEATGGAGMRAAQIIQNEGVSCVITGNVGPNAMTVLKAAGLEVRIGAVGSAREAVEAYLGGKLKAAAEATVGSHFGMR